MTSSVGPMTNSVDTEALSCRELVELVTTYLEHELSPADLARFEEHLAACGNCADYLDQVRKTVQVVASVGPGELSPEAEELSPEAEEALLRMFRGWLSG